MEVITRMLVNSKSSMSMPMKRLDACLYERSIQHCAVASGLIRAAGNGIQPFGSLSWLALPFRTELDAYHLPWQLQRDRQTEYWQLGPALMPFRNPQQWQTAVGDAVTPWHGVVLHTPMHINTVCYVNQHCV